MAAAACVPPAPYAATALGCGCSQVWCAARRPCALSFFVQPEESCGNSEVADCAARCCNNECAAQEGVASGGDDDEPAVCSRSRAEGPPSPGTASSTGRLPGRTWLAGSEQRWEDDGGGGCSSGGGGSGSSEGGDEEHDSLDGFFAAAEDSRGARKEQVWRSVRELRELVPGAAHVRGLGAVLEHVIAYMQALEARTLAMRRLAVHHRHCRRATAAALKLRSYQVTLIASLSSRAAGGAGGGCHMELRLTFGAAFTAAGPPPLRAPGDGGGDGSSNGRGSGGS